MSYILILGATSDIALALARKYATEGYNLYLAARQVSRLEPDSKDLAIRYGINVQLLEFDARKFETHESLYKSLNPGPDIVCCVFGFLGDQTSAQQRWQESHQIIEVNYTGAVSILNTVANEMEANKQGTVIGISSVAGERGRGSNYLYGSAKAGFTAYLSGLRNRLTKSGVHVLTVKPGFVDTAMTAGLDLPGPITAKPEQVANDIYKAALKKKNVLYTLWMWRYIMWIIRNIPESIFKKLSL